MKKNNPKTTLQQIYMVIGALLVIALMTQIENIVVNGLIGASSLALMVYMMLRWRREKSTGQTNSQDEEAA
jgi:uncharacterized membrane protein YfcA